MYVFVENSKNRGPVTLQVKPQLPVSGYKLEYLDMV